MKVQAVLRTNKQDVFNSLMKQWHRLLAKTQILKFIMLLLKGIESIVNQKVTNSRSNDHHHSMTKFFAFRDMKFLMTPRNYLNPDIYRGFLPYATFGTWTKISVSQK